MYFKCVASAILLPLFTYQALSKQDDFTCKTWDDTPGKCMPVVNCTEALARIKKRLNIPTCYFDKNIPIVCCPVDQSSGIIKQNTTEPGKIAFEKCKAFTQKKLDAQMPSGDTGVAFVQAINGIRVLENEFGHMAAIGFGNSTDRRWLCGGSLISEKFVLTAAHCLVAPGIGEAKWVRLGNIQLSNQTTKGKDYEIIRRIRHPNYDRKTKLHDIALLEMRDNAPLDTYYPSCLLVPLKLYPNYLLPTITKPRQRIATGWGVTENGSPSDHLLKVFLEKFDDERCRQLYKNFRNDSQLCVGSTANKTMDTCQGDSGGPLQIENFDDPDQWIVIGVTSYGKGCGFKNIPAVYARVDYYIEWIENIVWANS